MYKDTAKDTPRLAARKTQCAGSISHAHHQAVRSSQEARTLTTLRATTKTRVPAKF